MTTTTVLPTVASVTAASYPHAETGTYADVRAGLAAAEVVIRALDTANLDAAVKALQDERQAAHLAGDMTRRAVAASFLSFARSEQNLRKGGKDCHCGGLITPEEARNPYRSQCVDCDGLDAAEGAHYAMLARRGIG